MKDSSSVILAVIAILIAMGVPAQTGFAQGGGDAQPVLSLVSATTVRELSYDRMPQGRATLPAEPGSVLLAVEFAATGNGELALAENQMTVEDSTRKQYVPLGVGPGGIEHFIRFADIISGGGRIEIGGDSVRLKRAKEGDPIQVTLYGPNSRYVFVYRISEKAGGLKATAGKQSFPVVVKQ